MRIAVGIVATLVAGAAIVWAAVQVQDQLARGADLAPWPFIVAGVALGVIVLVALLSDSIVRNAPRRGRSRSRAAKEYGYTKTDRE